MHLLTTLVTLNLAVHPQVWASILRPSGGYRSFDVSKHKGDDLAPMYYAIGSEPTINTTAVWTANTTISLDWSSPLATLDYGNETAGFPFLDVKELSHPVQVELRYGEEFAALQNPNGDGPWTFVNGLSNTFRTERFNITTTGRTESFFVQGGQRWQSIRLLTEGSISLNAGFRLTSDHLSPEQLSGRFSASNALYGQIFDLGGRAVQAACIDAGAAPAVWEITSDGVRVRGQQTSQSALGVDFSNYTISFMTKIVRGGTGFRIASGIFPSGSYFVLTTQSPPFVDTNRTVLPLNSLIYNYGFSIVNQSTVTVPAVQIFPVTTVIVPDKWYNISVTIGPAGYNVSLDSHTLAFISFQEAYSTVDTRSGPPIPYTGTWGFGPFQDQDAYFKDVQVLARNGTVLYSNPMTSKDVLAEYSVLPNQNPVCMDGAKRDRLVWIGDFAHTCRVVLHSTNRRDYIRGTIVQALQWSAGEGPFAGFAAMDSPLGASLQYKDAYASALYGITDYQDLLLLAISDYYQSTGDLDFIRAYWTQISTIMTKRLTYNDPVTLLSAQDAFYFLGPDNGTAPSALNVLALKNLASVASSIGDSAAADHWMTTARNISAAINSRLWNAAKGFYSLSLTSPNDFSLAGIAFTIRAGIANATQAAAMIENIPQLRLGIGFKDSSVVNSTSTTQLSPNVQGFLLEALFIANREFGTPLDSAQVLLDTFWPAMVTQNEYYSGASWEYAYPDGSPGIDLFTSLSHPWGAAPTYVLPEYILGIGPLTPGYTTWSMQPLIVGLGLTQASGIVPTSSGQIEASWKVEDSKATVCVRAPNRTKGEIILKEQKFVVAGGRRQCVTIDV